MKKNKLVKLILILLLLIFVFLSGCSREKEAEITENESQPETSDTITITDMAGRTVNVPSKIEKVYCKSPSGTILMYTLAPNKLVGWNYEFTENEKKYIDTKYLDLPVLGGWFGKNTTGNIEEILKVAPDIIIDMGAVNDTTIDADNILQEQIGIPVIMIDNEELGDFYDNYVFLGKIIGEEKKAQELADYCKNTLDDAIENARNVSAENRVKVYYAEGPEGLQTEPKGSARTELIRLVGGENVAMVSQGSDYGRSDVSLEQVLLWNPDFIIAPKESEDSKNTFFENVYENKDWENIKAIKDKNVYGIPQNPFGWFDRPTSVNRIIGIKWIGNMLYPEIYKYDMIKEVKDFYEMFYHCNNLTDDDCQEILNSVYK